MHVLLDFRHGLGDAVQLTAVLRHLRHAEPAWQITVSALQGKHSAFYDLADAVHVIDSGLPPAVDRVYKLAWDECWITYADSPSTKVERCLRDVFDIAPQPELLRYQVPVSPAAAAAAAEYLDSIGCQRITSYRPATPETRTPASLYNAIAIHYEGNTSTSRKNLTHEQARILCDAILARGCVPIILDWDRRSPLPDGRQIHCPASDHPLWGATGTGDAEILAALLSQVQMCAAIDSGPQKVALATHTPTLCLWTGHHPLHYCCPSSNALHLVPESHEQLLRGSRQRGPQTLSEVDHGAEYFARHYRHATYWSREPLEQMAAAIIRSGALEPVRTYTIRPRELSVYLPPGIGDGLWALTKVPSILQQHGLTTCRIGIAPDAPARSKEFIERFDFVSSAKYDQWHTTKSPCHTPAGPWNYDLTGRNWHDNYDYLINCNSHLEHGRRLETHQAEFATEFAIASRFRFHENELAYAEQLAAETGRFVAFFLGPLKGNTTDGHNRGPLWTPQDWGRLADLARAAGLQVLIVGAEYDRSYYDLVAPHLGPHVDRIGAWEIAQTFAVLRHARALFSYQSGIGIFAVYLGIPTVIWWRPYGNSVDAHGFVSFFETESSAWAPPGAVQSGRYLPQIYTRSTPDSFWSHVEQSWL